MRRLLALSAIFMIAISGYAIAQDDDDEDEAPERNVTLDAATVARLGIATAPVHMAQFRGEANGYGTVIAYDALAQTDSDLASAENAVAASQTTLARARNLFAADVAVSRQTVDAAERQAAADAVQLTLAQRRAVIAWGQGAPWHNVQERTQYLARLASGDLVLARVTFSANAIGDSTPASLRLRRVNSAPNARSWTATTIWGAPADPTVPGRSFFVLIESARGLTPGERLLATLPTGRAESGAIIPASAMLIAEGQAWYYTAEIVPLIVPFAPYEDFSRQMLDLSRPTPEGYFVPGMPAGQTIVVEGAGLLLAREIGKEEDED